MPMPVERNCKGQKDEFGKYLFRGLQVLHADGAEHGIEGAALELQPLLLVEVLDVKNKCDTK